MGSRKRSARQRKIDQFKAELGGMDELFGRERRRSENADKRREAARRNKACASKKRYATRAAAQETIALCSEHGVPELHYYRCPYCHGWHLTSHPQS